MQTNVVPTSLTAIFDLRLDPSVDHEEFETMIKKWCAEAGSDVTYSFEQKNPKIENTKLDDSNPYWVAFKTACDDLGITLLQGIFPGGTDSRYVREVDTISTHGVCKRNGVLFEIFHTRCYYRLEFLLLASLP